MRDFFFVMSYNVKNPNIIDFMKERGLLQILGIDSTSIQIKSPRFVGLHETTEKIHEDFSLKFGEMFPKDEIKNIKMIVKMNPAFGETEPVQTKERWDKECIATWFFCEGDADDDLEDIPSTWLIKYEIRYEDDNIDLFNKNGQFLFDPNQIAFSSITSTLQ